jgi:hypothetical protein
MVNLVVKTFYLPQAYVSVPVLPHLDVVTALITRVLLEDNAPLMRVHLIKSGLVLISVRHLLLGHEALLHLLSGWRLKRTRQPSFELDVLKPFLLRDFIHGSPLFFGVLLKYFVHFRLYIKLPRLELVCLFPVRRGLLSLLKLQERVCRGFAALRVHFCWSH